MKKFWNLMGLVLLVALTSVGFSACSDDDEDLPKSYQLTINLNLKDGLTVDNLSSLKVMLINEKGQEEAVTLTGGSATTTVLQGQYTVSASGKVKDEAAAYATGKASVDVFAEATVTVNLEKIIQSPLIFKTIYSTGGKQGYVVDQYFEIVNNSDEIQYLDQLILSAPQGNQKVENAWQSHGMTDIYACGQGTVIAFPGSGKDYPLNPGESVLLANDAVDHRELAGEGNACPDLSKADWEVYIPSAKGEIDYKTQNVDIIFQNNFNMKAWGMGFFGRAYILARCPEGMTPAEFAANKENIMNTPGTTSTMEYLMIPSKYVLDAVDVWDGKVPEHVSTFLTKDDAKGISSSAAWTGKCVRRKVIKIENGRPYYQDTNNSSQDFLNEQPLTPGQTPTKVD